MGMPSGSRKKSPLSCSFCGKTQDEIERLIAGPNAHICNECVDLCANIIHEERTTEDSAILSRAREIQIIFGEAIKKEIQKHFEAGRSVYGIHDGSLVEIRPIKKTQEEKPDAK